jgi:hypothetical protein
MRDLTSSRSETGRPGRTGVAAFDTHGITNTLLDTKARMAGK